MKPEVIDATRRHDELMNQRQIVAAAMSGVNVYKGQLFTLEQQLAVVKAKQASDKGKRDLARQRKDIEDEILGVMAQQELAMRTAMGGNTSSVPGRSFTTR